MKKTPALSHTQQAKKSLRPALLIHALSLGLGLEVFLLIARAVLALAGISELGNRQTSLIEMAVVPYVGYLFLLRALYNGKTILSAPLRLLLFIEIPVALYFMFAAENIVSFLGWLLTAISAGWLFVLLSFNPTVIVYTGLRSPTQPKQAINPDLQNLIDEIGETPNP